MVRYIIDEEELKELIYQSLEYNALLSTHTHQWEQYKQTIQDFFGGNLEDTLVTIVKQELKYYDKYNGD